MATVDGIEGSVDRAGRCTGCGTRLWAGDMPPLVLEFTVSGDDEEACLRAAIEQVKHALGGHYAVDMGGFKQMRMTARTTSRAISHEPGSSVVAVTVWEMDVVYVDDRRRS